jgi:hypothetical protein
LLQKLLQSYLEIDLALLVNFETPRNLNLGESPKVPPPLWLGMKHGRFIDQSIRPLSVTNCLNGMSNFSACSHWLFRSAFDQCNFHLRRICSLGEAASSTLAPWLKPQTNFGHSNLAILPLEVLDLILAQFLKYKNVWT